MQTLLESEYNRAKTESHKQRLKAWKARLQSPEKQGYKWVQGQAKVETLPMKTAGGAYTVDRTEQFKKICRSGFQFSTSLKTRN